MTETTTFILLAIVGAVFLPLLFRHARSVDQLEVLYRERIRDHHPRIGLDRRQGALQYLVIDELVYPSSVIDFRGQWKQRPEDLDAIIDDYLASVPSRYKELARARTAG